MSPDPEHMLNADVHQWINETVPCGDAWHMYTINGIGTYWRENLHLNRVPVLALQWPVIVLVTNEGLAKVLSMVGTFDRPLRVAGLMARERRWDVIAVYQAPLLLDRLTLRWEGIQ